MKHINGYRWTLRCRQCGFRFGWWIGDRPTVIPAVCPHCNIILTLERVGGIWKIELDKPS